MPSEDFMTVFSDSLEKKLMYRLLPYFVKILCDSILKDFFRTETNLQTFPYFVCILKYFKFMSYFILDGLYFIIF